METKEMKIVPPEGYEIDKENSTFECVKFKPIKKDLTYEDVAKELFLGKDVPYIDAVGNPRIGKLEDCYLLYPNNCTSKKQCEKLLAINKLMNVAKYLNDVATKYCSYYIYINKSDKVGIGMQYTDNYHLYISFNSKELAQQAIDILGEEAIRLALSTDW